LTERDPKRTVSLVRLERQLCAPIFASRLQLSSAGTRTFSYDVVWDFAAVHATFGEWRHIPETVIRCEAKFNIG
jgi:hypothetical protein